MISRPQPAPAAAPTIRPMSHDRLPTRRESVRIDSRGIVGAPALSRTSPDSDRLRRRPLIVRPSIVPTTPVEPAGTSDSSWLKIAAGCAAAGTGAASSHPPSTNPNPYAERRPASRIEPPSVGYSSDRGPSAAPVEDLTGSRWRTISSVSQPRRPASQRCLLPGPQLHAARRSAPRFRHWLASSSWCGAAPARRACPSRA